MGSKNNDRLRAADDVRKAHDMIGSLLDGQLPSEMNDRQREALSSAMNVLCWVLCHDHNKAFATVLYGIDQYARRMGYGLFDRGEEKEGETPGYGDELPVVALKRVLELSFRPGSGDLGREVAAVAGRALLAAGMTADEFAAIREKGRAS